MEETMRRFSTIRDVKKNENCLTELRYQTLLS